MNNFNSKQTYTSLGYYSRTTNAISKNDFLFLKTAGNLIVEK